MALKENSMRKTMRALAFIAIASMGLLGCSTTPTQDGAVLGSVFGAGLGAILGHQSGHQGEGALIGAGAGALIGAIIGDSTEPHHHAGSRRLPPPTRTSIGHYETRVVTTQSGSKYEERVWVEDR
jgi:outer membrane lipoprotein SlyB